MVEKAQEIKVRSLSLDIPKGIEEAEFATAAESLAQALKDTPGTDFQVKRWVLYGSFIAEDDGQYTLKLDGHTRQLAVILAAKSGKQYLSFSINIEPLEVTLGPESEQCTANQILEVIRIITEELRTIERYKKEVEAVTEEVIGAMARNS